MDERPLSPHPVHKRHVCGRLSRGAWYCVWRRLHHWRCDAARAVDQVSSKASHTLCKHATRLGPGVRISQARVKQRPCEDVPEFKNHEMECFGEFGTGAWTGDVEDREPFGTGEHKFYYEGAYPWWLVPADTCPAPGTNAARRWSQASATQACCGASTTSEACPSPLCEPSSRSGTNQARLQWCSRTVAPTRHGVRSTT